jgi:hypothetical protein
MSITREHTVLLDLLIVLDRHCDGWRLATGGIDVKSRIWWLIFFGFQLCDN